MTPHFRFRMAAIAVAVLALGSAFLILNHSEATASEQSTDDAYVQAHLTVIAPRVGGWISSVAVEDNQTVKEGASLVTIDDRELLIALDTARANVDSLRARLERQSSTIAQAEASELASRAGLELAWTNRQRYSKLASDGSGTVQAQQQANAQWEIQRAVHARDIAGVKAAEQEFAILSADLRKARAAKDDAELRLSYSRVLAPISGVVAQRKARVGGYARVGEPLLTLVPLDALYVEAHFRETQLARVRVGQPVEIEVDAFPGLRLKGRVESLGPASGVSFSPLPPHNATGNFTKIVQRIPVRIELEPGQTEVAHLRVGMSVRPSISVASTVTASLLRSSH